MEFAVLPSQSGPQEFRKTFGAWVVLILFSVVCFKFILMAFFFKNCLKLNTKQSYTKFSLKLFRSMQICKIRYLK